MPDATAISRFLQVQLRQRGQRSVSAIDAGQWLDEAGLLRDSSTRPGKPLRDMLRAGQIVGRRQVPPGPRGHWYIDQVELARVDSLPTTATQPPLSVSAKANTPTPQMLHVVLPDVLQPGLQIVFCGTAAGDTSARIGAYYAGPGNQFWAVLYRIGLTPRQLLPAEYRMLPQYGLGLTDLAKMHSGTDDRIPVSGFDSGGLQAKLQRFTPQVLAFNGKRSAEAFYGWAVDYGLQAANLDQTRIFVLPSTSGAARGYWDEGYWRQLAALVRPGDR